MGILAVCFTCYGAAAAQVDKRFKSGWPLLWTIRNGHKYLFSDFMKNLVLFLNTESLSVTLCLHCYHLWSVCLMLSLWQTVATF